MPGHLALPGGAFEPGDRPGEAGDSARCVAREVAEETGLAIEAGDWIAAGTRITPPMFPVRFHTDFFVAMAPDGWNPAEQPPSPDEIESLRFVDPVKVLAAWERGDCQVPPPVLPILRQLAGGDSEDADAVAVGVRRANELEQRAPRIEFVPDVWMLPVETATLPPATHTNVWMPGRRRYVVIDPGCRSPAVLERLREAIGRRPADHQPLAVVLTHGHQDHASGATALATMLDVPVQAHPEAARAAGLAEGAYEPLEDGRTIELDGLSLRSILTPGHAPGHLAFHVPERRALIAGDLVSGISTILIDPEHGDMGAYLDSLERVRALDCRILLPGHGSPMPARALQHLIDHRRDRESRIGCQLGGEGTSLSELARTAYEDVPQMPAALTERQTLSHLLHLERMGEARRIDPRGRCWVRG